MTEPRPRTWWLAWALAALGGLVMLVTAGFLASAWRYEEALWSAPLAMLSIGSMLLLGAIVASRLPRNPIGWLFLAIALLLQLNFMADEWIRYAALARRGTVSVPDPVLWIYSTALFGAVLFPFILLFFPSGRVPSRRWRAVTWLLVGACAAFGLTLAFGPQESELTGGGLTFEVTNPYRVPAFEGAVGAFSTLGVIAWLAGLILACASLAVRFRRSEGEERQQIRWVVFSGLSILVALGLLFASERLSFPGWTGDISFLLLVLAVGVGLPVSVAVALLKYRLYDLGLVVKKTVVFAILAALMMTVAIVLLVFLAGDPTSPAWFAGLVLGLSVWPLWRLARRIADRVVYGGRSSPYEILTEFSQRAGETFSSEDVLYRMAAVLGQGTGAEQASVWLDVAGEARLEAVWPSGSSAPAGLPDDAVDVTHQGQLIGALAVRMPSNDPMNPSKDRLVRALAAQAGPVLRNVRLIEDLRDSRRRLVSAQDEERRRLERNIHDGAQQQLVALQVKLRLAGSLIGKDEDRARTMVDDLQEQTNEALQDLRDLARGIYPPLLADKGLVPALEAQARRSSVPVSVEADEVGRFAPEVEAAVYFSTLEALQNVAKYAGASRATISLAQTNGSLTFTVSDDGRGFDHSATGYGTGLQGMADRVGALEGELMVESAPGEGTTVVGTIPATEVAG